MECYKVIGRRIGLPFLYKPVFRVPESVKHWKSYFQGSASELT